jgi:hypothetical protein
MITNVQGMQRPTTEQRLTLHPLLRTTNIILVIL